MATKFHYACSIPEGTGFFFSQSRPTWIWDMPSLQGIDTGFKAVEDSHLYNDELLPSLTIRFHDVVINDVIKFGAF